MNDVAANLLLGLLTLWPVAYVVSDARPFRRSPSEGWLDLFWRLVRRPGSCLLIAGGYWIGAIGMGPFSREPGWLPLVGAGYILVLAAGTAGARYERSRRA